MATKSDQAVSDQKKRTLDALEQRFAVAKAEVLRQEQKNKKQLDQGNKDGNGHPMDFSYPTTSARENEASGLPSSMPSSKRGRFAFSGSRGISKISEIENGATYSLILQPIDEKLLNADVKFLSGRGSVVDNVLHDLLQKGDSAQKYMKGSKSTSIDNWILLDNFVQRRNASAGARIKALQSQSKRSTRHMSMKQHRKCGSLDFPREYPKFDIFKPMHEMWKNYMMQLLKIVGKGQLAQCLLTADLHGAILQVAECKLTAFTGLKGIMVRETVETLGIITQNDKFRVVPKKASVFIYQADCWKITLIGDKRIASS